MKKRVLSLIMALMLCLSLLPTEVLAEGMATTTGIGGNNNENSVPVSNGGSKILLNAPKLLAANTGNVAEVTIGGTTTQYTDIDAAFAAAQEADSATVTLLSDVTISEEKNGIYLEKGIVII